MLFCGIAGLLGSNDFAMQAKCSNISERNIRDMNWIRVSVALGEFLLVALIFAITLVRKEFRSVTERFFIYLLLATLFREAVLVANVEHQFEYWVMDEVCSVLGALDLYTAVLVIGIVACTVVYLLNRAVSNRQRSQAFAKTFELGCIILITLIPLIVSAGLLYMDVFGLSNAWCWMREYDPHCNKTSIVKRVLGGYFMQLTTGALSIVLTVAIVIIYYKIARQIKQAMQLLKQALILITCLILNVVIVVFAAVINLNGVELRRYLLYIYTAVISLYDIIYPVGFLIILKCMPLVTSMKRRSTYTSLPKSTLPATVQPSFRVSARSTTVPISTQYTGQFTEVGNQIY